MTQLDIENGVLGYVQLILFMFIQSKTLTVRERRDRLHAGVVIGVFRNRGKTNGHRFRSFFSFGKHGGESCSCRRRDVRRWVVLRREPGAHQRRKLTADSLSSRDTKGLHEMLGLCAHPSVRVN